MTVSPAYMLTIKSKRAVCCTRSSCCEIPLSAIKSSLDLAASIDTLWNGRGKYSTTGQQRGERRETDKCAGFNSAFTSTSAFTWTTRAFECAGFMILFKKKFFTPGDLFVRRHFPAIISSTSHCEFLLTLLTFGHFHCKVRAPGETNCK